MFLQIQNISFVSERTCEEVPGLLVTDVNKQNQIVARVRVNDSYFLQVFNRLGSRQVSPTIPSACNHASPCIVAHPGDPGFVLEGCRDCRVIRNYNIRTGERCVMNTGLRPKRMCHGPSGSILVENFLSPKMTVLTLTWIKEQELLADETSMMDKLVRQWCYAESFDVLVTMNCNEEIKAVKLENNNPIWKLSGAEPDSLTTDAEGNIYVGDGANSKILKINGLTGDVISVFLLEDENTERIHSLFWSGTEPNLTLICEDRISTYNV